MRGKTIVVTGAGGALGSAVARAAAARGARVALIDVGAIGGAGDLKFPGTDLTNRAAAEAVMAAVRKETGRLDTLLNIAGGFASETLEDSDLAVWDRMFALNLKTALTACKAALPHLIASGEGRIVNIGALGATKAGAGMGAYAASKAAIAKLTESLAEEMKGRVTVNAVLPSTIDTPANRTAMPQADFTKWVSPADLAAVILFLASGEARAITGALIPVTGQV
ncbi:MAG TPA: SDR family NAD(P)-dependent oxidoreductase [Caulobacterales bacterium]|nr:SDR family NAD(P)-dependent oxidoreductase [Caulobacterales bacterium]